jgi:hypothetical protein
MITRKNRTQIPFQTGKVELEYEVLTDRQGNKMYMQRKWYLASGEDPEKLRDRIKLRSKMTALFLTAVKNYQTEFNCTREEAEDYFVGGGTREAGSMYNYLTPDQIATFQELDTDSQDAPVHVATLLIRTRCLYPLVTTATALKGANMLLCEPVSFELPAGSVIRINGRREVVETEPDLGATHVLVRPLTQDIEVGAVGFLMEGRSEKAGVPDWTFEDSWDHLNPSMQNEIFRFYREESDGKPESPTDSSGAAQEEGNAEPSTKTLTPGSDTPPILESTGEKSIGESNSPELAIKGSQRKTLANSHAG